MDPYQQYREKRAEDAAQRRKALGDNPIPPPTPKPDVPLINPVIRQIFNWGDQKPHLSRTNAILLVVLIIVLIPVLGGLSSLRKLPSDIGGISSFNPGPEISSLRRACVKPNESSVVVQGFVSPDRNVKCTSGFCTFRLFESTSKGSGYVDVILLVLRTRGEETFDISELSISKDGNEQGTLLNPLQKVQVQGTIVSAGYGNKLCTISGDSIQNVTASSTQP